MIRTMSRFTVMLYAMLFTAFVLPVIALAQEATEGPTWKGIPLMPVISLVLSVLGGLWAIAQRKIAAANEEAAKAAGAKAALIRLGAIGFAMAGTLWERFSREFQLRIADGKIDEADRDAFRQIVEEEIEKFTSREELQKLAVAAGLPMPGIVAWVAEYVIDRVTKAHSPSPEVAAGAFPVKADDPQAAGSYGG